MSAAPTATERGEPNLTPILDMVFQLITFFMLVINFKSASLDFSLKLPVVGSARPVEGASDPDQIVLNIDPTGKVIIYGVEQDLESYITREAQNTREMRRLSGQPIGAEEELPTTVVIRADQSTSFSDVNRVLKFCQSQGYRKFSLKALNSEGG